MSVHELPSTTSLDPESSSIDIQNLPSIEDILSDIPRSASVDITEVVYAKVQKLSIRHNVPYGFFNRTSWLPQSDPSTPLIDLAREKWDKNQLTFTAHTAQSPPMNAKSDHDGTWVDLIVNNLDDSGHPFHLVRLTSRSIWLVLHSSWNRAILLTLDNSTVTISIYWQFIKRP